MLQLGSKIRGHGVKRLMRLGVSVLGLAIASGGAARAGVAMYTATPLGYLPGDTVSWAYGINASGDVVGTSYDSGGNPHAFVYDAAGMQMVGPGQGIAINNAGEVLVSSLNGLSPAYVYGPAGGVVSTVPLPVGGSLLNASALNDSGQVVGAAYFTKQPTLSGFVYAKGSMTQLGTLGGAASDAQSINDRGQVVGFAYTASGSYHAVLYSGTSINDLGTLGGANSQAFAINAAGDVVGVAQTTNSYQGITDEHAFLYSGGVMTDLGALDRPSSDARAINDLGQIVGESYYGPIAQSLPFIYEDGTMYDLNSLVASQPDFTLELAFGINDSGQIAATALLPDGDDEAVLLTPIAATSSGPTAAALPLPAAVWEGLLGIGVIVACMALRRRVHCLS